MRRLGKAAALLLGAALLCGAAPLGGGYELRVRAADMSASAPLCMYVYETGDGWVATELAVENLGPAAIAVSSCELAGRGAAPRGLPAGLSAGTRARLAVDFAEEPAAPGECRRLPCVLTFTMGEIENGTDGTSPGK